MADTKISADSAQATLANAYMAGIDGTPANKKFPGYAFWGEKGADVASAGTLVLGDDGDYFHITGTTTITDIDFNTAKDGRHAWLEFDGALTLTHNSTTLKLPGNSNITTAAGDRALFVQDSGDNVHCLVYVRAVTKPDRDFEMVTSLTASTSSSLDFDSSAGVTFEAGYDYIIEVIELQPASDAYLMLRYGTGATPTYQATGYTSQFGAFAGTNALTGLRDAITTAIPVSSANGTSGGATAGETIDVSITVRQPAASAIHNAFAQGKDTDSSGLMRAGISTGKRTTTEVLTGLRLLMSTGNITSGKAVLYRRRTA